MGMSAGSYGRILGANDRINVCIMGLGRRLGAYVPPVSKKENNVRLLYLCDVMKSQRENAAKMFSEHIDDSKCNMKTVVANHILIDLPNVISKSVLRL